MVFSDAAGKTACAVLIIIAIGIVLPSHLVLASAILIAAMLIRWDDHPDGVFLACVLLVLAALLFVAGAHFVAHVPPGGKPSVRLGSASRTSGHAPGPPIPLGERHHFEAVEPDDILGGSAEVLVLVPELEIETRTYHTCPGQAAELRFYLRGGEMASDWRDWTISFYNEVTNETYSLEHVNAEPISASVAVFTVAVHQSGVYRFRSSKSAAMQHCEVLKTSGVATVVLHEPPSLEFVRYDCQPPLYLVFDGSPPFSAVYLDRWGNRHQFNASQLPAFFPEAVNATHFAGVSDAYCSSTELYMPIPPLQISKVNVERAGRNSIMASIRELGTPPVVLSYYKTNMTLHQQKLPPARQDEELTLHVQRTVLDEWFVDGVAENIVGATNAQSRAPGWLGEPEPLTEDDRVRMAPLISETCRFVGEKRDWRSFRAANIECPSNDASHSVIRAYRTCDGDWNLISTEVGASLKVTRPFSCSNAAIAKEDAREVADRDILEELTPDPEILSLTSRLRRQSEAFVHRRFGVFGIISQSQCGADCLILKCHLGSGEAMLLRVFRSVSCDSFEILAAHIGGLVVSDAPYHFNCSNRVFLTSHVRKSLELVEEAGPLKSLLARSVQFGSCGRVEQVFEVPEESWVAFARLESGHLVRLENHRDQDWHVVGSVTAAEQSWSGDIANYFDRQGSVSSCKASRKQLDQATQDVKPTAMERKMTLQAWSFELIKLRPHVEAATGNRYDCLMAKQWNSGTGTLSVVSGSAADCKATLGRLNSPASISELVSVTIDESSSDDDARIASLIEMEENTCYSFGHVRDGSACEGFSNAVEICSGIPSERESLPTIHISGGGKDLRPGESARVLFYATGEGAFSFDLYLNGYFLRRVDSMSTHLWSSMEGQEGIYTVVNFVDSRGTAGEMSGEARISFIVIPTASLRRAGDAPCAHLGEEGEGSLIDFIVQLKSDAAASHEITWTDTSGRISEMIAKVGETSVVLAAPAGRVTLVRVRDLNSGALLDLEESMLDLEFRSPVRVYISNICDNVCDGYSHSGFMSILVEDGNGDALPVSVDIRHDREANWRTHRAESPLSNAQGGVPSGDYSIERATDAYGCEALIDDRVLNVGIFERPCCHVPNASSAIYYAGDVLNLKCSKHGTAPLVLKYSVAGHWRQKKIKEGDNDVSLPLEESGAYFFSSIKDVNGCESDVGGKGDCVGNALLNVLSLPSISWAPMSVSPCAGDGVQFKFEAAGGKPPYRVLVSHNGADEKWMSFDYGTTIKTVGMAEGLYAILGLRDGNDRNGLIKSNSSYEINVRPLPSAVFTTPNEVCFMGKASKNRTARVKFSGEPPFRFSMLGEAQVSETADYKFSLEQAGKVMITSLVDGHNCTSKLEAPLVVHEMPRVRVIGGNVICDGDEATVKFLFSGGVAPYRMVYSNGKETNSVIVEKQVLEIRTREDGMYYVLELADVHCSWSRTQQ